PVIDPVSHVFKVSLFEEALGSVAMLQRDRVRYPTVTKGNPREVDSLVHGFGTPLDPVIVFESLSHHPQWEYVVPRCHGSVCGEDAPLSHLIPAPMIPQEFRGQECCVTLVE